MASFYNDNDRFVCDWTSNLVAAGLLPEGRVEARPIQEVESSDLAGFDHCNFFNGISGWPLALRMAGWPDDRPAWSGSVPCQGFSMAGQRRGFQDERHLWPQFYNLIKEHRPPVVFGEQVEGAITMGWLDLVAEDCEAIGYSLSAAILPAAAVGAPHLRHRIYWVAFQDELSTMPTDLFGNPVPGQRLPSKRVAAHLRALRELLPARGGDGGYWGDCVFIPCADGKLRPTPRLESGVTPLATEAVSRVDRLRAYGNAIVPQVGAVFVQAFLAAEQGLRLSPLLGNPLEIFEMTWRDDKKTPAGRFVPTLRATPPRSAGKGWPTPTSNDTRVYSQQSLDLFAAEGKVSGHSLDLNAAAQLADGWATPRASKVAADAGGNPERAEGHRGRLEDQVYLAPEPEVASWPTPLADPGGAADLLEDAEKVGGKWIGRTGKPVQANLARVAHLSGWPTPITYEREYSPEEMEELKHKSTTEGGYGLDLTGAVLMTHWPTPNAGPQNDLDSTWQERRERLKAEKKNGNGFGLTLGQAVSLATKPSPWPTPRADDRGRTRDLDNLKEKGLQIGLEDTAQMTGWPTPNTMDHLPSSNLEERKTKGGCSNLKDVVPEVYPWATPMGRDWRSEAKTEEGRSKRLAHPRGQPLSEQVMPEKVRGWPTTKATDYKSVRTREGAEKEVARTGDVQADLGTTVALLPEGEAAPPRLNPAFSRWLQGFPAEWDEHVPGDE